MTLDKNVQYVFFSFQHTNAPVYKTIIKKWFSEFGVKELHQPAQSPDPNPIKHLWDELRAKPHRLTSVMLSCLKLSKIPKAVSKHLVEAFPEAVRNGKGEFSVNSHFEKKYGCDVHICMWMQCYSFYCNRFDFILREDIEHSCLRDNGRLLLYSCNIL